MPCEEVTDEYPGTLGDRAGGEGPLDALTTTQRDTLDEATDHLHTLIIDERASRDEVVASIAEYGDAMIRALLVEEAIVLLILRDHPPGDAGLTRPPES